MPTQKRALATKLIKKSSKKSHTNDEILRLLEAAVSESELGVEAMLNTLSDIERIKQRNIETASVVMNVCFRVKDIAWKFQGVDAIVQRLNVLVLSTKIFAAQAGEQGQGFQAIVAELDEHRDRLQDGVKDMKDVLEAMHQDAKNTNADIEREACSIDPVNADANQAELGLRTFGEHCAAVRKMMTAPAKRGLSNASEMARLVDVAIVETERGVEAITKTIAGIYRLEERNHAPSQTIFAADYRLGNSRERLETIHAIAQRWGDLAVHAKDLAAQAGKYRPGFQVIAEEIETLGKRLTSTAKETQEPLNALQDELKSEFVVDLYRGGASSIDPTVEKANVVERSMVNMRNICVDVRKKLGHAPHEWR